MSFSFYSIFTYNSYEARVNENYSTVEYNDNIYVRVDYLSEDSVFDKQIKAYLNGNSLYSRWLVAPMCYISNNQEYIKIITEDYTFVLYYKILKSTNN